MEAVVAKPLKADSLHVPAWELGALAALNLTYILADTASGGLPNDFINLAGPIALTLILGAGAVTAARMEPAAIWTGVLWFRISSAIYFGLGTVIDHFVNNETYAMLQGFYPVRSDHVATYNMIVASSIFFVLATVGLLARIFPGNRRWSANTSNDGRVLFAMGSSAALLGFSIKFFLSVPASLGVLDASQIPSSIFWLELLSPASIFLLGLWSLRHGRWLFPFITALTAAAMGIGFMRFGKGETLLPLLMLFLSHIYYRTTIKKLFLSALCIATLYHFTAEPTTYARGVLLKRHATFQAASLEERLGILQDYYSYGSDLNYGQLQGSVARLAYIYPSAPAIDFYNRGFYGTSLQDAYIVLFPRALWPDKPIFDHGTRYTAMINGNSLSSTWMGYFVEAYWNLGWWGIPLIMIPMGFSFFAFGRYAQFVLSTESWIHFPMIFLGMFLGFRVDGSLVTEFFVVNVLAIFYHLAANAAGFLLQAAQVSRTNTASYNRPSPSSIRRRRLP